MVLLLISRYVQILKSEEALKMRLLDASLHFEDFVKCFESGKDIMTGVICKLLTSDIFGLEAPEIKFSATKLMADMASSLVVAFFFIWRG